jgi:hypothetical protein
VAVVAAVASAVAAIVAAAAATTTTISPINVLVDSSTVSVTTSVSTR